eukprot:12413163-Prorocentrum_lima.AAC.1
MEEGPHTETPSGGNHCCPYTAGPPWANGGNRQQRRSNTGNGPRAGHCISYPERAIPGPSNCPD